MVTRALKPGMLLRGTPLGPGATPGPVLLAQKHLTGCTWICVTGPPTAVVSCCPPSSDSSSQWSMLQATHSHWRCHISAVPPTSCVRHLAPKLPKLHRQLHHAVTLGNAMHGDKDDAQGKYTLAVLVFEKLSCLSTAAHHLLCLQANLRGRMALTSANWLHTCNRSGTMRPTPTWAASPSLPKVGGRSGGAAASARPGSHTGGRHKSLIAQTASAVLTRLAKQCAPATTWPTTTQKWQQSETGRPMGKRHQTL